MAEIKNEGMKQFIELSKEVAEEKLGREIRTGTIEEYLEDLSILKNSIVRKDSLDDKVTQEFLAWLDKDFATKLEKMPESKKSPEKYIKDSIKNIDTVFEQFRSKTPRKGKGEGYSNRLNTIYNQEGNELWKSYIEQRYEASLIFYMANAKARQIIKNGEPEFKLIQEFQNEMFEGKKEGISLGNFVSISPEMEKQAQIIDESLNEAKEEVIYPEPPFIEYSSDVQEESKVDKKDEEKKIEEDGIKYPEPPPAEEVAIPQEEPEIESTQEVEKLENGGEVEEKGSDWSQTYSDIDKSIKDIEDNVKGYLEEVAKEKGIEFKNSNLISMAILIRDSLDSDEKSKFVKEINSKLRNVKKEKEKIAQLYIKKTEEGLKKLQETAKQIEEAKQEKAKLEQELVVAKEKYEKALAEARFLNPDAMQFMIDGLVNTERKAVQDIEEKLKKFDDLEEKIKEFEKNKEEFIKVAESVKDKLEQKGITIDFAERMQKKEQETEEKQEEQEEQVVTNQEQENDKQQPDEQELQKSTEKQENDTKENNVTSAPQSSAQNQTSVQQTSVAQPQVKVAFDQSNETPVQSNLPVANLTNCQILQGYVDNIVGSGDIWNRVSDTVEYANISDSFEKIIENPQKLSSSQRKSLMSAFRRGKEAALSEMKNINPEFLDTIKKVVGEDNYSLIESEITGNGKMLANIYNGLAGVDKETRVAILDSARKCYEAISNGTISEEEISHLETGILKPLRFACAERAVGRVAGNIILDVFNRIRDSRNFTKLNDIMANIDTKLAGKYQKEIAAAEEVQRGVEEPVKEQEIQKSQEQKNTPKSFADTLGELTNSKDEIKLADVMKYDVKEEKIYMGKNSKNSQSR